MNFYIAAVTAVATLLSANLSYAQTNQHVAAAASSRVGFYHWGGQRAGDFLKGMEHLRELNARVARITLSARMDVDYRNGAVCINNYSLPTILERPEVRRAVTEPQLDVVMITAYDGLGFSDCMTHAYLSLAHYTAENTARVVQEYSAFAYRLRQLNHSTRRRIILLDWEGDNAVYCGSAYHYVNSSDFRRSCHDSYSTVYSGNRNPDDSIEGMILWHRARFAGVADGNARADREQIDSPHIQLAPEVCAVHLLSAKGYKSVLRDVLRHVSYDYISFSSYESLASHDPAQAVRTDLDTIREITGFNRIIVGEMGFARSSARNDIVERTKTVLEAALNWGVSYIIQWNLHDQDSTNDFGMYDVTDKITELGKFYERFLIDNN